MNWNEEMNMITLNPLFTDQAVLQAEKECFLTGQVASKEIVYVQIKTTCIETISDKSGYFSVRLPAQEYGTICEITVATKHGKKNVQVQFGDVFLFGGQSNIEFKMANETHFPEEKKRIAHTSQTIFFLNVPQLDFEDRQETIPPNTFWQKWRSIDSESLAEVSAIAYYAMRQYQKQYPDRIIGIVNCSKGGTSASSWISLEFLRKNEGIVKSLITPYEQAIEGKSKAQFTKELAEYQMKAESYYSLRDEWQKHRPDLSLGEIKQKIGSSPWPPPVSPYSFLRPSGLYHTMFKKIVPYTFAGIIWYQGEEDTQHGYLYDQLLSLLIKQWRRDLRTELPVYIVQLPVCADRPDHDWAAVRQAQANATTTIDNTFLVTSLDCGLIDNIHPPEKMVLGERIGEIIQQSYYASSPIAKLLVSEKCRWVIEIENAKSLNAIQEHFICANTDDTNILIHNNKIEISTKNTEALTMVQYAWKNAPTKILFNEVGYPVSPFMFQMR